MEIMFLGILYLIGCTGWMLFHKLKVPSPALLGSLAFIGIVRAVGLDFPTTPDWLSKITQILLGFYMGSALTKQAVRQTRQILTPALVVGFWAITTTFVGGGLLSALTSMDFKTGVLSAGTGGITEMVVLAMEVGADSLTVVIVQTFRVIVSMSLYPLVAKLLLKRQPEAVAVKAEANGSEQEPINAKKLVAGLLFALVGGLLFSYLGIPAGAMIGSLAFMVIANFLGFGERISSPLLLGLLLTSVGMGVADSITPETISALISGNMLLVLAVTLLISFLSSGLLTIVVHKLTGWDWATCILACAPAGVSSMPIVAMEVDLDPLPISLLHLCRLFTIKACVPIMGVLFV
ncbi:MAG: AbrB family transcriptional regulator [Firmicutes bacterium]|nr:AbrB family transcriptional regulator [Bacillota bacterium]